MDVKEAVRKAKEYTKDLFAEEKAENIGLEEVEYDEVTANWIVTVGFSRPWDKPAGALGNLAQQLSIPTRSYKVVRIADQTGDVLSVKNRERKE